MSTTTSWTKWWAIPGPAAYIDAALDVLHQGRSLVLALPEHYPPNLGDALALEAMRDGLWQWTVLDPSLGEQPFNTMVQTLWVRSEAPTTLRELLAAPRIRHRVFWVDGVTALDWEPWRAWIHEFAHASQTHDPRDRAVVCCTILGVARSNQPRSDPALATLEWKGRVEGLDLRVWTALLSRGIETPRYEAELRRELIAEIAGTDPILAKHLVSASLVELLSPSDLINDLARIRGWDRMPPNIDWESGAVDRMAGNETVHVSALVSQRDRCAELVAERIWRAQMRVLFPLIEALRRRMIEKYRSQLRVPFQVEGRRDPITRIEDLEIGPLLWQLQGRIAKHQERLLSALHKARNALAHLEVLDIRDVIEVLRLLDATEF